MVSVIIPTYNCDKYICEAIDSVLCQSYCEYEIIVIDDGSTDNTRSIIDNGYFTVKYHYLENNGVAAARNFGISIAQGEFIAFLDADDKWMPTKLEKQVNYFLSDDSLGMVFTENLFFDVHGITQKRVNKRANLMHGDLVRNIFINSYVATPTVMVRKSVFEAVGLFEEELVVAEDDNMWMRIGMKFNIELIDETLVQCRIAPESLSRKKSSIYNGVMKHIEVIKLKYPDIYERLGPSTIRTKYSELLFSEGYWFFADCKYREARSYFSKSYRFYPFRFKPLLYVISTYLPTWIIEKIRSKKSHLENWIIHD